MASYPSALLRDVCASVEYGYTASSTPDPLVGPRFLRITDIVPERLDWDSVPFCEIEPKKLAKHRLHTGDIVVARTGATTGWAKYINNPPNAVFASYLVRLRPSASVDARYVGFVVESSVYKEFIQQHMGGAAQPNANAQVLTSFEIPLPPLPIQRRIAGILSAYDELIENSQRRIKILESMARALYREWFVHFRFPGHESVPRVPSSLGEIPQGWAVSKLGEHLDALESGKRPKGGIREVENGVPSIGAENINGIGQHDFAGEKFIPREFFQEMRKGVVRDRDVAIYKDGAYIGKSSYFRDGFPHVECCVNEHVFLLRASGVRLKQNALYLWLQEPETVQTIRSKNANAAQPGINQQTVGGLELILPSPEIATQFDELVDPLFAEVINLSKKTQNLRRTRDLLLPRLLSGQIDVDAMPS